MSPLERLPVELLEKVYLYALNLSLPVSSPIIAGKLSSEMIFVKTATAIFEPTWQEWLRYTEDAEDSTFPMNQHLVELQVCFGPQWTAIWASPEYPGSLTNILVYSRVPYWGADGFLWKFCSKRKKTGFSPLLRANYRTLIVSTCVTYFWPN